MVVPKSSVRPAFLRTSVYYLQSVHSVVSPCTFVLQIAAYVQHERIRLSEKTEAYVRPKSPNYPSSVLSDPKPKLTQLTKLLIPS
jgi:hypothetical protein